MTNTKPINSKGHGEPEFEAVRLEFEDNFTKCNDYELPLLARSDHLR